VRECVPHCDWLALPRKGDISTRKERGFPPYPVNGMGIQPKYSMNTLKGLRIRERADAHSRPSQASNTSVTAGPRGKDRGTPSTARHAEALAHAAFAQVVERYQHTLHAFLYGMIRDMEEARDLVQDTFSAAWLAYHREERPFARLDGTVREDAPTDDIRRWLFHTAYCRAVSALRRRKRIRWECLIDGDIQAGDGGEAQFEEHYAEGEALSAALAQLTPGDAAVVLLRVVHGFSAAEVGQMIGASAAVVNKRLSRAKGRLREAYLAQDPQIIEESTR
jgi:RNA polymerase sigma factor (sigma-70 family)